MTKSPLWKYLLILAATLVGAVYALPNLYGEYPAIQISPTRTTKVDVALLARAEGVLNQGGGAHAGGAPPRAGGIGAAALKEKRGFALEQNMTSLRNRVNELGVAEPIIQQQGEGRIGGEG